MKLALKDDEPDALRPVPSSPVDLLGFAGCRGGRTCPGPPGILTSVFAATWPSPAGRKNGGRVIIDEADVTVHATKAEDRFHAVMVAIVRSLPFGLSRVIAPSFLGFALINGLTFAV